MIGMRVAILHDYLNQYGGAERVLEVLLELFPDADLYTLLYDAERTRGVFEGRVTKTSFLDVRFVRRHHRAFIPLMPLAASCLRSRERYDLVISSTAGYAKGFRVEGGYHVCYCLSPLRYAWEPLYLEGIPFTPWPLRRAILHPLALLFRAWDRRAAARPNVFAADSKFIADKVKEYYGRDAEVIEPPVDTATFHPEVLHGGSEYYLMVGRLLYYKRFDIGIRAFNGLRKQLKIVGMGPEFAKLQALVDSPYIEFIPNASDDELRLLYANATALIFPQVEDFGLVAAESLACGTPVIAFGKGGAAEIVSSRAAGLLFHEQTPTGLARAVREFEGLRFDRHAVRKLGERFSKDEFKRRFATLLASVGFTTP
jgi:glycosyltransferase involved in cell wall biosynthesis